MDKVREHQRHQHQHVRDSLVNRWPCKSPNIFFPIVRAIEWKSSETLSWEKWKLSIGNWDFPTKNTTSLVIAIDCWTIMRDGAGVGGGGAARARGGVGGARKLTIASRGRGRGMSRGHGLCFGYGGRAEDGASESKDGDGTEDRSRRDDERHWSLKNSRQRGRDRDLAEEENEECAASLQRPTGQGNIESGSTSWGRELSFFYYYLIN